MLLYSLYTYVLLFCVIISSVDVFAVLSQCCSSAHQAPLLLQAASVTRFSYSWSGCILVHVTVRYKVIWTDYDRSAVVYSCHVITDDGRCRRESEQLEILSRDRRAVVMTSSSRRLYDVVREQTCVDFSFRGGCLGKQYI